MDETFENETMEEDEELEHTADDEEVEVVRSLVFAYNPIDSNPSGWGPQVDDVTNSSMDLDNKKGHLKKELFGQEALQTLQTLEIPTATTTYRRDRVFRSRKNTTESEVHDAVYSLLDQKYNKANGRIGFSKPQQKLEWHNCGEKQDDHVNGKFDFTFCDGTLICQATINIYKSDNAQNGACMLEGCLIDGDRDAFSTILDKITKDLMSNMEPSQHVLEGLISEDFSSSFGQMPPLFGFIEGEEDFNFEFVSFEQTCTPTQMQGHMETIQKKMKWFEQARYYQEKKDGIEELIQLLESHPKTFVDCCIQDIQDKAGKFVKAFCKCYKKESAIALARCLLIFVEKLAMHATEDLVQSLNYQTNGVFATIFESWPNWRKGGRYSSNGINGSSSWIVDDQIGRTLLALLNNGFNPTLKAGRRIPLNYMKKNIEICGPEYVRSFSFDFEKAIGQTFSKDFQDQLERHDKTQNHGIFAY